MCMAGWVESTRCYKDSMSTGFLWGLNNISMHGTAIDRAEMVYDNVLYPFCPPRNVPVC